MLRAVTMRVMRELIRTQAQDGYLGPFPDKHLMDRWDLRGHYHCMLAMVLWSRDTGDMEALHAATRAADLMCATFLDTGTRVYDAGSHEMNMAVIKEYRDLTLYVNGRCIGTTSVPGTLAPGPEIAGVGCNPNFSDTESFRGCIADVLFSRDAMTEAQIAALAAR